MALAPTHTFAGRLKLADGGLLTVRFWVFVDVQPPALTVRLIVLLPALDQLMLKGPAVLAVDVLAPAPKFHEYEVPPGATPLNVIVAFEPVHTAAGLTVKEAVGEVVTEIVPVPVAVQVPEVTLRLTVLLPELLHCTEWGPGPVAVAGLAPLPKFQV